MNCFSGTLKPLTAICGSAGSSPLGSGATARRLPSSNWMSAVTSEIVLTVPVPYCGWRTRMSMCRDSIFMPPF